MGGEWMDMDGGAARHSQKETERPVVKPLKDVCFLHSSSAMLAMETERIGKLSRPSNLKVLS